MEALRFTKTAHRTFHDVAYMLTISGDTENLSIEVEHAEDGRRWRSQFGARFIEEITQRTGNHKKFDVFVKMALSALSQESDAVYLDVLTARDLEMLRRHANPQGPPTTSATGQSDKRYLILTYRAEFDKVHYPLPLQLDERSEEETLRNMVARLKTELVEARETIASFKQGSPAAAPAASSKLEEDYRHLQRRHSETVEELGQNRRELDAMRSELRGLRAERDRGGSNPNMEPELRKLKDMCQRQQAELKSLKDDARQKALNQKRETEQTAKELKAAKQNAERLQAQVRKLEEERKALGVKLQSASRGPSAERSRAASRTPSAERSGPASRVPARTASQPRSRPVSRASSVASSRERSRERTPSPNLAGSRGTRNSADGRPWAFQRNGSPASGTGARRSERQAHSPGSTLSPYGHVQAGVLHPRRTSSPGNRSRDRTPSPAQQRGRGSSAGPDGGAPVAGSGAAAASRRSAFSLREQRTAPTSAVDLSSLGGGGRAPKPSASRYGGRPPSATEQADSHSHRSGSHGPGARQPAGPSTSAGDDFHRPGSLFGLAANLGLGPGSLAGAADVAGGSAPAAPAEGGADACDIDARLQALQSFLKQTKTITG